LNHILFIDYKGDNVLFSYAEIVNSESDKISVDYININKGTLRKGAEKHKWNLTAGFTDISREDKAKKLRELYKSGKYSSFIASGDAALICLESNIPYVYFASSLDVEKHAFGVFDEHLHFDRMKVSNNITKHLSASFKADDFPDIAENGVVKAMRGANVLAIPSFLVKKCEFLAPDARFVIYPNLVHKAFRKNIKSDVCKLPTVLFSPNRHSWFGRNKFMPDCQGNDIIIEAFAKYKENYNNDAELHLIKCGPDFNKTKEYAESFGLENSIIWHSFMPLDILAEKLADSDAVIGTLTEGNSLKTDIEALATGTPVIANSSSFNDSGIAGMPPVINGWDADSCVEALRNLSKNYDVDKQQSWVETNTSVSAFEQFINDIETGSFSSFQMETKKSNETEEALKDTSNISLEYISKRFDDSKIGLDYLIDRIDLMQNRHEDYNSFLAEMIKKGLMINSSILYDMNNFWLINNKYRRYFDKQPETTLQIGPGKSLGMEVFFCLSGAKTAYTLDPFPNLSFDIDSFFEQLYTMIPIYGAMSVANGIHQECFKERNYKKIGGGHYQIGDSEIMNLPDAMENISLDDEKIDFAYSIAVLEHVKQPDLCIKELSRIMKKGGLTFNIIDLRDHRDYDKPLEFLKHDEESWQKTMDTYTEKDGSIYLNRWRYGQFIKEFENNNFEILDIQLEKCHDEEHISDVMASLGEEFSDMEKQDIIGTTAFILARKI
jgi:glycosyltransferase involved in cell wall biosynthesis/SAM-dependent methyltransferase